MRIYKISYAGDPDGHKGYGFFPSLKAARLAAAKWDNEETSHGEREATIEALDIPSGKSGVIRALNTHAGHPDNG